MHRTTQTSHHPTDLEVVPSDSGGTRPADRTGEDGTTTAEYTVVTAAAVAFGALLLKLLTGSWGAKILETAFREVIKMLGF